MKTQSTPADAGARSSGFASDAMPIMAVADAQFDAGELGVDTVRKARQFAEPLLADEVLMSGEGVLSHADAVAAILASVGGSTAMQAATYLVYACGHLQRPKEVIAKRFGDNYASLAVEVTQFIHLQAQAR